jgi:hypothetical protein
MKIQDSIPKRTGITRGFLNKDEDSKNSALVLIDQIIEMEKTNDLHYQEMMRQLGRVPACGTGAVEFHLMALKSLIEKI